MMTPQTHSHRLLRRPELEALIAKSRSWIYSTIDPKSRYYDPTFPKPIKLGGTSVAWIESEVIAWIDLCIARRNESLLIKEDA